MSLSVLTARCTVVFSIGWNSGAALIGDFGRLHRLADARRLRNLREHDGLGACGVPGTDARTRERSCSSGICLKSAGRFGVANVQGPVKSGAENHRPATRK